MESNSSSIIIIKPLPESVRSSLRSGFIICDLTRVVEELVYNSLDAGATRIAVSLGVGTGFVKVEDDGFGIDREGLILLGERYATSKFHYTGDVADGSVSFGFLGETLCSLSDISVVEIITKTQGRPNGYRKVMKGRKCLFLGIDDDRRDVGTTVIVRDLFYNQPVRSRLLRSSPKKALHSVKKCVFRVALIRPKVSFKVVDVESEDKLLRTHSSSSPLPLLKNESGIEVSCLEEMDLSEGAFKLAGYVSSSFDSCTTKAVQYIYINSRILGKGPIHNLLNHLANSFWDQLNGDHIGKRSRPQACPVYILNLICPKSFYDLIFESSGTSIEFKDWSTVLSFLKKSLASVWCRKISKGEPATSSADLSAQNEMGKQTESVSAEKGWSETCGSFRKRCRIQNQVSPDFEYISSNMEADDSSLLRERRFDKSRESMKYTTRCGRPRDPEDFTHQIDLWGSTGHYNYDYTRVSSDKTRTKNDEFLEDISVDKRSYRYAEDHTLNSWCKDGSLVVDAKHVFSEAGRTKNHLRSGCWNKEKKAENFVMAPFLQNCSSKSQVDETSLSSSDNFQMDHLMIKQYSQYPDCSDSDNFVEQNDLDHNFDVFTRKLWKNDSEAGDWFPTSSVTRHWHKHLDDITRNSNSSFFLHEGSSSKEDTDSLVEQDREFGTGCFSSTSDWHSEIFNPVLHTNSWNFERSDQDARLGSLRSMMDSRSEQFRDDQEHVYVDNVAGEFECKNFLYGSSSKSTLPFDHDTLQIGLSSCGHDLDGPSTKYVDVLTGREELQALNPGCEDYMNSASATWQTFDWKETNSDMRRLHQQKHISSSRSRRSHSAPPIYKGKRQFLLTTHSLTSGAVNHDMKTVPDAGIFREERSVKKAKGASSHHHQNPEKNDSEVPCNDDTLNVKATVGAMLPNGETQNNQLPGSHGHGFGSFLMEGQDPESLWSKWRNGAPPGGVGRLRDFEGGDITRKLPDDCSILDISAGILHLACDSLIPKSVSRSCFENAKVLLQVDKKFIPVVAGGVLAVIDQHAADERIRLEELHKKVLSGEVKSITYLEVEKELVLPEMTYQFLYNYAEPIKGWGWICSIHIQGSGSFKKDINLLNGQPSNITLLAVPCILGVNLTDADLMEYLEQLAATDGSSTMPAAVLRVLNNKSCRGAIMFGDTLLPSECSLIVEELKQTSLCFQCAHGRPTTAPLINLGVLHKQVAALTSNNGDIQSWHGLCRQGINLERSKQRLDRARGC